MVVDMYSKIAQLIPAKIHQMLYMWAIFSSRRLFVCKECLSPSCQTMTISFFPIFRSANVVKWTLGNLIGFISGRKPK